MPQFVLLWTDIFIYASVLGVAWYVWHVRRTPVLRDAWREVARSRAAMCSAVVLAGFVGVGLLDSIHFRQPLPSLPDAAAGAPTRYSPVVRSALDEVLAQANLQRRERSYSAPLALRQFLPETRLVDGEAVRGLHRLDHAGRQLADEAGHAADLRRRAWVGLAGGAGVSLLAALVITGTLRRRAGGWSPAVRHWWQARDGVPWRPMWLTFTVLALLAGLAVSWSADYYVLGTDRTGNDVLYQSLKSIRTALVIGSLTTLAMLPPALGFGLAAGYFRGRVDDLIQYLYTTLTAIPGVLLVAACVLVMQVYLDMHPELFDSAAARADLRLFVLCMILGLTGWAGLCRLLRAETMKLRELEYVQAAQAFGVGPLRILRRHVLPNVAHLVLITVVLEFSALVLYEAVLSYLGIGVDASTPSFGIMIDAARVEMSRDPVIWWNLVSAFAFLLALVLSANLFADAVQRAFDPRTRGAATPGGSLVGVAP